jgi:hypothetical protein
MNEHTPEPWEADLSSVCYTIYAKQGPDSYKEIGDTRDNKANAERIVACVNACAGIETETLAEGPTLAEVIRMRKNEYDNMKADADRLAEALRLYIGDDYKCTWWERRDRARSALKSHERGEG